MSVFNKFIQDHRDEMEKYFSDMRDLLSSNDDPELDPIEFMMKQLKDREFGTDIPPSEYEHKLFFVGICAGIVIQDFAEKESRLQGLLEILSILGKNE